MPVQHLIESKGSSRTVHNKLLLAVPSGESETILKNLRFMDLPQGAVLNEVGQAIKHAYFINSGVASVLKVMADGKHIEVGLCGSEGFVGLPLLAGLKTSATQVVMQIGGSGYAIHSTDLLMTLEKCPTLNKALNRFGQELTFQAMQVAACNQLHAVEQRLAKWLLMSQDRLGGDLVPLTQEFLADMLGTRRASVTVAAGELQRQGLISYKRGELYVRDRRALERASCECYEALRHQNSIWDSEVKCVS
jgi:CRP-like cAMP-binding protein